MFRTSFGFEMLHKARRRARLKALKKKKEKKIARYHAHFDKITTLNAVNSPLLRLPAELRNMIFAFVYTGTEYMLEGATSYGEKVTRLVPLQDNRREKMMGAYLFLVCRQMYSETSLLPYKLGWFWFEAQRRYSHRAVVGMRTFLRGLSPRQLHAIGKLMLWRSSGHPPFQGLRDSSWSQVRTGAYWLAKLDETVFASDAKMYDGVPMHFDIANFGPSDSKRT